MLLFAYSIQSISLFNIFDIYGLHLLSFIMSLFFACSGSSKVATRLSGIGVRCFSFVGSYKPVTIFLDFVWGGRPQLEEEEKTDAALVFQSTGPHLRRNSVTHLKPS